jgi:hypothetical protein
MQVPQQSMKMKAMVQHTFGELFAPVIIRDPWRDI